MNLAIFDRKWAFPGFCVLITALILIKSVLTGEFGQIGPDSDDALRLTQIRDYLIGGQSWFDTDQSRMGLSSGTDMHWSRLVDIPIIALTTFFDLFLSYERAEALAISLWPPMSASLVLIGVFTGARFLKNRMAAWIAAILASLYLVTHYRFTAGAIDHHNIQFGLICLAAGFALDPTFRTRSFVISGICTALTVAIGTEVYIFAATLCLFIAALWLLHGPVVRSAAEGFGWGLAGTLIFVFLVVTSPSQYGQLYCDSLSWIVVAAGTLGGLGLVIVSRTLSGKSLSYRLIGLVGLGAICLVVMLGIAPQCLSNPLSDLPADVKTLWLDNIVEAQPLFGGKDALIEGPLGIGVALTALVLAALKIRQSERRAQYGLLAAMLAVGLVLSSYQLRFVGFGQFLAFMVTGVWVYELANKTNAKGERSLAYIGALALSVPMVWALPGVLLGQGKTTALTANVQSVGKAGLCYSDTVVEYMNSLPKGRILATDNGTPTFLTRTEHSVLAGNYHRNADGIQTAIRAYTVEPIQARTYLMDGQIDYVHVCRTTQETVVLTEHSPSGLMAKLAKNAPPDYLEEIKSLEDGAVLIYRFTQR